VAGRLDLRQVEMLDDAVVEVLRQKLWISVRKMLATHIRHTHPQWDERTVEREVARRLLHGAL
jgi:hypothetical protein